MEVLKRSLLDGQNRRLHGRIFLISLAMRHHLPDHKKRDGQSQMDRRLDSASRRSRMHSLYDDLRGMAAPLPLGR